MQTTINQALPFFTAHPINYKNRLLRFHFIEKTSIYGFSYPKGTVKSFTFFANN
jgi:hypothetical protein